MCAYYEVHVHVVMRYCKMLSQHYCYESSLRANLALPLGPDTAAESSALQGWDSKSYVEQFSHIILAKNRNNMYILKKIRLLKGALIN